MSEETEILKKLLAAAEQTRNSINVLAGNMGQIALAINAQNDQNSGSQTGKARPEGVSKQSFSPQFLAKLANGEVTSMDMIEEEVLRNTGRTASSTRPGIAGLYDTLGKAQMPSRDQAVGRAAYGSLFGGGSFADKLNVMGVVTSNAFASEWRPADQPSYDENEQRIAYSSGKYEGLSHEHRKQLRSSKAFNEHIEKTDVDKLSAEDKDLYGRAKQGSVVARETIARRVFKQGENLSAYAAEAPEAVAALGKSGRMFGAMAGIGEGAMAASRFIAGPAAIAYEVADQTYKLTKGALYDPARSAAGLGYGFSYDPTSKGFQTSFNRSVETNMDALFSMSVSGEQTKAARAAVEGMGLGGPGSELAYYKYYHSMKDVIGETQLSAQTLSPFYEQFMRQGGKEDDVGQLTKMLSQDLPAAAAASRMSLEAMANMIQKTTEAASANVLNTRTKSEISQSLIDAQQAGAPPSMAAVGAGTNAAMVAMTAARLSKATGKNVSYLAAQQMTTELDITAAETLKAQFGNMTSEQFAAYRLTDAGALKVMTVQALTGLTVDDQQKLFDQGLDNFEGSVAIQSKLGDSNLGPAKSHKIMSASKKHKSGDFSIGGIGDWIEDLRHPMHQKTIMDSQMIKGTNIDLYKSTGIQLQKDKSLSPVIKTLEDTLKKTDPEEEKDFEKQLKALRGKPAKQTWELLQKEAKKVENDAATGNGQIVLSNEARKFFHLNFKPNGQMKDAPNAGISVGGITIAV